MYIIKKADVTLEEGKIKVESPYCYLRMSFDSYDKAKEGLKELFESCDRPVMSWSGRSLFWENNSRNSFLTLNNAEGDCGVIYKIASA